MIFTVLPGDIPLLLKKRRQGHIFGTNTKISTGYADLGEAGANRRLPRDKGRATRGATLLAVVIGKLRALIRNAVDVRGPVPHHAHVVGRQIPKTDIVAPNHQYIRLISCKK
jgi:hypothetical protein